MAGLMYSKYHGALIILLTVLANLKLLLNSRFWSAGVIALILYIPHLLWQIENGFPTFQYQMLDRMNPFRLFDFILYWPNQLFAFNPLILSLLLFIFYKKQIWTPFEKTLKFIIIGLFGFFWLFSFTARIEAHWTAAAAIPAIILLYQFLRTREQNKIVFRLIASSVVFLFLLRLVLIIDILPWHMEFLGQKKWVAQIEKEAGNLPVVFMNSYQKASVYSFYTGKESFSLNTIYYRQNQFDLWKPEINFNGKPTAIVFEPSPFIKSNNVLTSIDKYVMIKDTFYGYQQLKINFSMSEGDAFKPGEMISLPIIISNPYSYTVHFNRPGEELSFSALFLHNKEWQSAVAHSDIPLQSLAPGESKSMNLKFNVPQLADDTYQFGICLRTPTFPEAFNSSFQKIDVTSAAPK